MNKLLVFQLAIQSSYADNVECEADEERFDTIQWWFSENETWRIKTFAIDQDIHTYRIAGPITEETALENTKKHYGDVVDAAFILEFKDLHNPVEVSQVMEDFGGSAALAVAKNGEQFAFWNPLQLNYSSKTRPA